MHYISTIRAIPTELRCKSKRELLIMGYDTVDIANFRQCAEAKIYNEIAAEKGIVIKAEAPPARGPKPKHHPIEDVEVGQSFVIPTRSNHSRGSFMQHLKKKLGSNENFVVTPEESGIRIIRVS